MDVEIKDIIKIYELFPIESDFIQHLEKVRWKDKPICPYCKSPSVISLPKENRHHCNSCNTSFSVTVGTIFHHTHLPLGFEKYKHPDALRMLIESCLSEEIRKWAKDTEKGFVLEELDKRNPTNEKGIRKHRFHKVMDEEKGYQH